MFRVEREKIGGNIHSCSDDSPESNISDIDDGNQCEGDECQLPEWAAEDQ